MITRFAPSPTGYLHLGHAYAAWVAWSAARRTQGRFLLRWEDIDESRCRDAYEAAALEDLAWLGLSPDDSSMRQRTRLDIYGEAVNRLRGQGLLYPCFCTRKAIRDEIARVDEAPHGPDGPVYPGICRSRSSADVEALLDRGTPHAWRLKMDLACEHTGPLTWVDRKAGEQCAQPEIFGDVVVARKDTPTSYHLAVTVDDAAQGVSLVTRGEDLFAATHIHRLIQELLDLPVPQWLHHRLICDATGARLATRDAAASLRSLRQNGQTPEDIHSQLGTDREESLT